MTQTGLFNFGNQSIARSCSEDIMINPYWMAFMWKPTLAYVNTTMSGAQETVSEWELEYSKNNPNVTEKLYLAWKCRHELTFQTDQGVQLFEPIVSFFALRISTQNDVSTKCCIENFTLQIIVCVHKLTSNLKHLLPCSTQITQWEQIFLQTGDHAMLWYGTYLFDSACNIILDWWDKALAIRYSMVVFEHAIMYSWFSNS